MVINIRDWLAKRDRNAVVERLIVGIRKYCRSQGPFDAVAVAMAARLLNEATWKIIEQMAGTPADATTRQLVLDEAEDRARHERLGGVQ